MMMLDLLMMMTFDDVIHDQGVCDEDYAVEDQVVSVMMAVADVMV